MKKWLQWLGSNFGYHRIKKILGLDTVEELADWLFREGNNIRRVKDRSFPGKKPEGGAPLSGSGPKNAKR